MRTLIIAIIYGIPIVMIVHWGWDVFDRNSRDSSARLLAILSLIAALGLFALFAMQVLPVQDTGAVVRYVMLPLRSLLAVFGVRLYLNLLAWPQKLVHRRLTYLVLIPIFAAIMIPSAGAPLSPGLRDGFWVQPSVGGSPIAMAFGVLINLIVAAALFRAWRTARHSNARGRFKGVFWANVTMGIVTLVLGIALQGRFSAYLPPYFYVLGWIAWLTMVRRTVVRYALVPSKSQRHSLWFDQYPAALILTDASGRVVDMNTAAQAMVGAPHALSEVFPPDSARADWERFLGALKSGAKVSQWEQPIIDAQRQSRLVAVDGEVLDTGSSRYWAFGLHDARRGHHDQELAQQLLYTDPLTGISSAFGFRQQLDHVTKLQPMEPAAVIFMDLDNFKTVNDTFGHRVGDRVLVDVAKRLAPLFRPGDVVARLGGDEFVALLRNTRDLRVEELLARIMRELERPLDIPEVMPLAMSVSIGLARYPLDSLEPEILLHQADQAMYEAKRAGKNQFRIYRSEAFQEM